MSFRTPLLLGAGLALAALPGCQNNDTGHVGSTSRSTTSMSTSAAATTASDTRAMNQRTADDLLREAQESERQGNNEHAMEIYQYLRGFPANSRPADIDQRIDRLRTKMSQTGAT